MGILEMAKEYLFSPIPETAGKQRFVCASKEAKNGKPLGEQDRVSVVASGVYFYTIQAGKFTATRRMIAMD